MDVAFDDNGLMSVIGLLCCPLCAGGHTGEQRLEARRSQSGVLIGLACEACREVYPVEDKILMLLPPHLRLSLPSGTGDELTQKRQQRWWHDQREASTWNIDDPHHAPLKQYCLYRQLAAGAETLPVHRPATVLNVCCGSGLEAEFFAQRYGVPVIGTDISPGMLRNAVVRAHRGGFGFVGICADTENLPFRSLSVDVAVVLHGLHHLASPVRGLAEMARVSKVALLVFEPATSAIRKLMIRLGVVSEIEESGNFSYDFDERSGFSELLRARGFDQVVFRREMYSLMISEWRLANVPPLEWLAERSFDLLHVAAGRWGTKLTVAAWRSA